MERTRKKRISFRRVLSAIGTVVLVVLMLFSAAAVIFAAVGRKEGNSMLLGYGFFVVVTDSMEPEIMVDDMVFVKEVPESEIAVGDDIVFYSEDKDWASTRRVHRVIAIENGKIYTQGIKEGAVPDGAVKTLVGKVVGKSTVFGKVFSPFVRRPWLAYAFVSLSVGVILIMQLVAVIEAGKEVAEEKRNEQVREAREQAKETAERAMPSREYLCEDIDFDVSKLSDTQEE